MTPSEPEASEQAGLVSHPKVTVQTEVDDPTIIDAPVGEVADSAGTGDAVSSIVPEGEQAPALANAESLTDALASALVIAGIMVLVFVLLRRIRQNRVKASASSEPARDRIDRLQDGARSASDAHALAARAHESVQEIASRLENRATRLEILLDQADARISELERLSGVQSTPRPEAETGSIGHEPAQPSPALQAPTIDPLHQQVHAMADEGLSTVEIARQIDRPTGQVELILALRRA